MVVERSDLECCGQARKLKFIKNFIEDDGIDESTKNKLKRIKQKDFFNLFSELIEDKASYKDIDYRKFKAMLKNKNDPGLL